MAEFSQVKRQVISSFLFLGVKLLC